MIKQESTIFKIIITVRNRIRATNLNIKYVLNATNLNIKYVLNTIPRKCSRHKVSRR